MPVESLTKPLQRCARDEAAAGPAESVTMVYFVVDNGKDELLRPFAAAEQLVECVHRQTNTVKRLHKLSDLPSGPDVEVERDLVVTGGNLLDRCDDSVEKADEHVRFGLVVFVVVARPRL